MFGLGLAALIWVLRDKLSLLENLCLTLQVATFSFWGDIFTRLGPAEAYAVVGVSLFAIGLQAAERLRAAGEIRRRRWLVAGTLIALGGMLAAGSKENFLLIAFPALYLLARMRRPGPQRLILGASAMVVLFSAFVGGAAMIGIRRFGTIYRDDASFRGRMAILEHGLHVAWAEHRSTIAGLAALLGLAWIWLRRHRENELRPFLIRSLWCLVTAVLMMSVHLSQLVFYNGKWPTSGEWGRYDFPGLLAVPLLFYLAWYWVVMAAGAVKVPSWMVASARCCVLIAAGFAIAAHGFPLPAAARRAAASTQAFTARLAVLEVACQQHPDWPMVFESRQAWNYEPLASLQRFMGMLRCQRPVYLQLHYRAEDLAPRSFERHLAELLERYAAEGGSSNPSFPLVRPWSEFRGPPCLALGFGGVSTGGCSPVVTIP
jgi:hypothetical protein